MSISLICASELKRQLERDHHGLRILDARIRAGYEGGHIPGAVWLRWEPWCAQAPAHAGPALHQPGYWGELADPVDGDFAGRLSHSGLSNADRIVVYADGKDSKGSDGRVAWMLLYLGAQEVMVLDGGWRAWQAVGGRISVDELALPPGRFVVQIQQHRRITFVQLAEAYKQGLLPALIDSRTVMEFEGQSYDYQPRRGRLPNSVLLPFASLYDEQGRFIEQDQYKSIVSEQLGEQKDPVVYCEVGVRAASLALIHEIHTGQILRVYDGSLMEWSLDPDLPMIEFAETES